VEKLQQVADHIATEKVLEETRQQLLDGKKTFKETEFFRNLKAQEQIYATSAELRKCVEEAQKQLNSPNFNSTAATRAALRFVTGVLSPLEGVLVGPDTQIISGALAEIALNAERVTDLGGIETITESHELLEGQDVKKRQEEVESQYSLQLLKMQVDKPQADLVINFVTWPDAYLWNSFGKFVRELPAGSNLETILATARAIDNCSPHSSTTLTEADLTRLMDQINPKLISSFLQECKKFGTNDPLSLTASQKRLMIGSSMGNIFDALGSHGMDYLDRKIPRRVLVAKMAVTMVGKAITHLNLDTSQKF
jgi:hypothetical protein